MYMYVFFGMSLYVIDLFYEKIKYSWFWFEIIFFGSCRSKRKKLLKMSTRSCQPSLYFDTFSAEWYLSLEKKLIIKKFRLFIYLKDRKNAKISPFGI